MFRSIRARIAVPYMILSVMALATLATLALSRFRATYLDVLAQRLTAEARSVAEAAAGLGSLEPEGLDPLAQTYARLMDVRVTIIAADGTVLGDSEQDYRVMPNHRFRPEIQRALRDGQGQAIRHSDTLNMEMLYVAVAFPTESSASGVVRVALPLSQINAELARLRGLTLASALVIIVAVFGLAILVAHRIARPILRLKELADRIAGGDLSARVWPATQDEVARLTRSFNQMAKNLEQEMAVVASERARMEAVLTHMADGAMILDGEGLVSLINPAASRLLGIGDQSPIGRSLIQVARHHQLAELWQRSQETGTEQTATIEIGRDTFLQGIVTPFGRDQRSGYLVVLQDLTRIRRLESIRRDFISNISHELRTPLASLQALVDTLRDGALDDPPAAMRFLSLMETEVDTLTQMVRELLELSRIESGQVPLRLAETTVEALLLPPVERLRPQAERAGLGLEVSLPPGLPLIRADCERVQQVVTNLVHNAIKFTPPNGRITCGARAEGACVVIWVRDTGVGISPEDLPRVFERFYKADRARSGGGTGLGLAISKHIVQAHGGLIWAESEVGRGSTFYFSLPTAQSNS